MATPSTYRCKVAYGNGRATLFVGRRKHPVTVSEMSCNNFIVQLPSSLAKKLTVGKQNKFFYQDMLWRVECTNKWLVSSDMVEVDLLQVAELTPPKIVQQTVGGTAKQTQAIQGDYTLLFTLAFALTISLLIMPAWGGEWGTSELICSAAQNTMKALGELIGVSR
jgi:hypothetical protein